MGGGYVERVGVVPDVAEGRGAGVGAEEGVEGAALKVRLVICVWTWRRGKIVPALLTSASMRPCADLMVSKAALMESSDSMSI